MLDEFYWERPSREELAQENLARLRQQMQTAGIDALIVNRSDNLRYVTGVVPIDCATGINRQAALVLKDVEQPVLFASGYNVDLLKEWFWISDIRPLPRVQTSWPRLFAEALRDYGIRSGSFVLLDPYMYYATGRQFERDLKDFEVADGAEFLAKARAIKSSNEIKKIRKAAVLGEMSLARGFEAAREGITEIELAAAMSYVALAAGAEALYARRGTLVTSGEKLARLDETPSSRKRLRRNEFVLMDVGPMAEGYYCDFARTIYLGTPSRRDREIYTAAYRCLHAVIEAMRPGITGSELDRIAKAVIGESGFGQHMTTLALVGHGVGLMAQEPPYIVAGEEKQVGNYEAKDVTLEPGIVMAVSTAICVPEVGGCRFEELVHVTSEGPEILSRVPYPGIDQMML